MTTTLIIGGALLVGMGLVASQLFRLKDWLNRQPPVNPDGPDGPAGLDGPDAVGPDEASPPNQQQLD